MDPIRHITTCLGLAAVAVLVAGAGLTVGNSSTERVQLAVATAAANPPTISTFAGSVCSPSGEATAVGLEPTAVAPDWRGGFYVADWSHSIVCHVTADGVVEPFAGNGSAGYDGDGGPAVEARLYEPTGVAADWAGNVYVADRGNHRIRRIDPAGVITTFAGMGQVGFAGDGGPATEARLRAPAGVAWSTRGEVFIADSQNHVVRRVDAQGIISTLAGTGQRGFGGDGGPGHQARLRFPSGVSWAGGSLYVADAGNNRVRVVGPDGRIHTFAGTGQAGFSGDGGASGAAALHFPMGVSIDPWTGMVHIADSGNHRIRTVHRGVIQTTVGTGSPEHAGDGGLGPAASLDFPNGVLGVAGRLWIADRGNRVVRGVDAAGTVSTLAGNGTAGFSGEGAAAVEAQLFEPVALAETPEGDLLVADGHDYAIRRIDRDDRTIHLVAGTPGVFAMGVPQDQIGDGGPATAAVLGFLTGLAVAPDGTIYVSDWSHRVRRITPDGTITTVAGNGVAGFGGDGGPGHDAQLNLPSGLALGPDGDLYVADTGNNRVRHLEAIRGRVEPSSQIQTVAGTGAATHSGDGGPATAAAMNWPIDVLMAPDGRLYVADHRNHRIRAIGPDGTITTVAGSGQLGYTPEYAPALSSAFNHPAGLALTAAGDLVVSDKGNCILRTIVAPGTPGSTVHTIAGWTPVRGVRPVCGFDGDGGSPLAGGTRFFNPLGLHIDAQGVLYVADSLNHRVRAIG